MKVSPRTCGRIMAKHRALYGWEKPKGPAKPKKDMPFKASRRHELRRLADYYLNRAPTWDEIKKAHRKFVRDYNAQIHNVFHQNSLHTRELASSPKK
jgi:hypothetical protein